jgi:hypothetical protein
MRNQISVLLFLLVATSNVALACSFDTDCEPGSKCLKPRGQIYGVCAGGMSPGNSNDRQPVFDQLDPNRSVGNTCSFDLDCGVGNQCLKNGGSLLGVCIRSR